MPDEVITVDLERLDAALASVELEIDMPVRRSFQRLRTDDDDPAPVIGEHTTRRPPTSHPPDE